MTSGIRSLRGAVVRSILRTSAAMLLVGLVLAPVPASAEDMVLKWNDIAARTAVVTSPFNQARVMAIVQLSVFEAVNAITGDYEPYLDPPTAAVAGASLDAAVIIAAHRALTSYFPAATMALDAARNLDLGAIPDGPAKTAGMAAGMAAANAMIALRATDGSAPPTTFTPSSTLAGDYQLTTGCAAGVFYNWQNVTPFGIPDATAFLLDPPPVLGSQRYTKDYYEVMTVGSSTSTDRPADRDRAHILR